MRPVQRNPDLPHNFIELPTQTLPQAFRPGDPDNLPLQEARKRFMNILAANSRLKNRLFNKPLRLWMSLTPAAAKLCNWDCIVPWFGILYCAQWKDLDATIAAGDPQIAEEQRANIELIPLREALINLALQFGLMYRGEPSTWAMGTIVETLIWRGRHPTSKRTRDLVHDTMLHQAYPSRTETDWVKPRLATDAHTSSLKRKKAK
jgi:hypothetical protein